MSNGYEFHPLANLFPLLEGADLESLAADIRAHGLQHPVLLYEGRILDGRNRYNACRSVGIEPEFAPWSGADPLQFVLSENLHRRQLTTSQKAVIAVEVLDFFERQAKERIRLGGKRARESRASESNDDNPRLSSIDDSLGLDEQQSSARGNSVLAAGKLLGVGEASVCRAKRVKNHAPDLFAEVAAGKKTISRAVKEADARGVMPKRPQCKPTRRRQLQQRRQPYAIPPELQLCAARLLDDFSQGLAEQLTVRFVVISHPHWVTLVGDLRTRLAELLAPYKLVARDTEKKR